MVKTVQHRTRFKFEDFEYSSKKVEEHILKQCGSIALMVWQSYDCNKLVLTPFFQVLRVGDGKYTIIVQKFPSDGSVSVLIIEYIKDKYYD